MRRLVLAVVLVSGIVLAAQPAGAQQASDLGSLVTLFDPDGEPCSGVPNQIPGIFNFTSACQAHDACFPGGGNPACDQAFRQDMLALCVAQHPQATDPLRYACFTFAQLYYAGARLFGPIAWG